jgi:hypothetical protein
MRKITLLLISLILFSLIGSSVKAAGASLYVAPSKGTFFVGNTFTVSIYVNTKGNEINAVQVDLKFPPDILQVTSPTTGESFISEWITPPSYSNIGGTIYLKGGIPEGITTSAGLFSTITFRTRSSGRAMIEFLDSSKVLLADEKGTPLPLTILNGEYEISTPPPEGPRIISSTHYDSEVWYSDPNPSFYWEKTKEVTGFSFSLSQNPQENPDTISEGDIISKSYEGVSDGIWFFHLRAKEDSIWGKTSHLGVKIDTSPPQEFDPQIDVHNGLLSCVTEDVHSGIDRYEVSVLNVTETPTAAPFFVEAVFPYKIPHQDPGKYNIIVKAYDRAGNVQEGNITFQKLSPLISLIGRQGIQIREVFLSWFLIYSVLFVVLVSLGYLVLYLSHRRVGSKKGIKEIEEALEQIEKLEQERLKERFEERRKELEEKFR